MGEVWSDVVYTKKSEYKGPPVDLTPPKTEQWSMPDTNTQVPEKKTELWEMPNIPAPKPDTSTVDGGGRIDDTVQTPDDDSWFDKVMDFLNGLPKPDPEPAPAPAPPAPQPPAPAAGPAPTPPPPAPPAPAPAPPAPPIPAEGRTFKTQGDPLVKTGDGMWFGVHEPGRYVSLKSQSGDFVMEQEISKTKDGRKYNTAMGFKLDNNTISIDTNDGNGPGTLTVNGQKYDLKFAAHGIDLPGGGRVTYDPKSNSVKISGPDGDEITVRRTKNAAGVEYLNAEVTLDESRPSGSVHGLLGSLDADTDARNDTRGRDGQAIAVNGTTTLDMNDARLWKTPEEFAREWRTQAGEGIIP